MSWEYTRCKWCGHRWLGVEVPFVAGVPLPGKDLKCPECGLDGATVVLDFDPQRELAL
jgi:DNA-directed RNA polymerase subunit RPC12/RpoP